MLNLEAGEAVTEEVLVFLPVCVLVVPGRRVWVVDVAVSFFWDWQPRKAVSVSAMIKDKTDVFIVVKLN